MKFSNVRVMIMTLVALLAISMVAAPVVAAKGRPLQAGLAGASEVPGPGDPDGTGTARLRLNQGRHRICYKIEVSDIEPATAAHIHLGDASVAGPVVVTLGTPDDEGIAEGCVSGVERSLIKAIRKHSDDYYVNVHNAEFPGGALRGQLDKWAPGRR